MCLALFVEKPLLRGCFMAVRAGAVMSPSWDCWDTVRCDITGLYVYSHMLGGTLVAQGAITVGDLTSLLLYTVYVGSGLQMLTYALYASLWRRY